jgi:hypothetical protein
MNDHPLTCAIGDDGLVHIAIIGDLSEDRLPTLREDADRANALIRQESERQARKLRALVDMSAFTGSYVPEAITAFAAFEKKNAPYLERTAGFGGAERQRLAADIVTALSTRDNISFFDTEDEARVWLARA